MDNMPGMKHTPSIKHMAASDHKRPPLAVYDTKVPAD